MERFNYRNVNSLIILFLSLPSISSVKYSYPIWSLADATILRSRLSNAEICFISKIANYKNLTHAEKAHFHAIRDSVNCTGTIQEVYSSLKSIFCPIGVERYDCFRYHMPPLKLKFHNNCGISAPARLSFWSSYWENLPRPHIGDNYAVSLLQTLKNKNIIHFRFVGDSIAGQIRSNL